ncbi:adenylate/guanylate cyclase domain-containing protein [Dongia sedimenti]|uniref:Adenylate/guanylate cyclase domain-containing protein n=1 Tax=Dongia sedimenti TaxID=3064282 RepID=A0ABU0YP76_9PROT|nr:adenylate/guanylate cyclase domain-containing protein [Rhodospirillaceae bacterium R-7]
MTPPDLQTWLITQISEKPSLETLFTGFCKKLVKQGLPIWRSQLGLETLHPEDIGFSFLWVDGALQERARARPGLLASSDYINSPAKHVDDTGTAFTWKAGEDDRGMGLIKEFIADGVTDYVMLPLPFLDNARTASVSFATKAPGGFGAEGHEALRYAATLFSPLAERIALRRVALDALTVYLGATAAQRAYAGQIERGDVRTLQAAILIADLRGFTLLSDRLERRAMVALLDRWFGVMGEAIEAQGGDILKFMGDGLLAVFPLDGDASASCARALAAAQQTIAGTAKLNEELVQEGQAPLRFGMALHCGDVEFGNIGAKRRIDFTVIGPAVNHASRLEGLTKVVEQPLVLSDTFAHTLGKPLRSLGSHVLRGVREPVEVFVPE